MKGYEKQPSAVSFDRTLSFGARALYPALMHLAWKALGRQAADEEVELPQLHVIAAEFGCSKTTLRGYLSELTRAGWLSSRRAARNRPALYVIHSSPSAREAEFVGQKLTDAEPARGPETDPPVGQKLTHEERKHLSLDRQTSTDERPTVVRREPDPGYDPVRGRRVGGRDLVWDAVVEVTGASSKASTHIVRQAVASIRQEAWQAAQAAGAASLPEVQGDPDAWEQILAAAVVERGREVLRLYPEGGPMAVARHWRRVEIIRAARERRDRTNGGGQSAFDVAAAELARIRGGAA